MNAPNPHRPDPVPTPQRRWTLLALTSLVVSLGLLPAPLAVLYDLNDECLRATSWTGWGHWRTLWAVPPLPVAKSDYLMVRGAVIVACAAALLLFAAAIATFRSRRWSLRLHAAYVSLQLIASIALIVSAYRFSQAIDATAPRDWLMHLTVKSSVRATALFVAGPALLYPLILSLLYTWLTHHDPRQRLTRR